MGNFSGRPVHFGPAVIGSLAGTVLFGVVMTMMKMMGMVAALVGSQSVAIGWAVHLAIGAVFGLAFAFVVAWFPDRPWLTGMLYGMAVWVSGPLIVMPLWLGMPGMVLDLSSSTPWFSLMGHLLYGLVTGIVYARLGASAERKSAAAA